MTTRAILGLAVALLVASCASAPRHAPSAPSIPVAWREASTSGGALDRSALDRWWTMFQDPVLDALVARAIDGNLDLKIAAARIREARAVRGIAASAALPQVDAAGRAARIATPGIGARNAFEAGFDAGWELDLFGGVRSDVAAATAQVQAVEEDRRDILVTLLADVAREYTEVRGLQRRIEILDETVQSQQDTVDLVQARFDAGLGAALDVERARGLLDATRSRRPELERAMIAAGYRLDVLIGDHPGTLTGTLQAGTRLETQPPGVPETLPSELLSRRPDLRRAEREVAAAIARVDVARADLFPRFSIGGTFARRSEDASIPGSTAGQFWFLFGGVRLPVLSGGRIRANIHAQDARQEQTLGQYERAVLRAVEEVENALTAHTRELRRFDILHDAAASNRRARDLATERYTGGLENFLSVLDAQRAVYAAEDAEAESRTRVLVTLIAVYKALGGGWTV